MASVIGPAEIDELMAEYIERVGAAAADETPAASWPVFVNADHLDPADRELIGSFPRWVASTVART